MGGVSSLALGSGLQIAGRTRPFAPTDNIVMHGKATVTAVELVFYPYQVLDPIFAGGWPERLEVDERPLDSTIPERFSRMSGTRRFYAVQIAHTFVHYFESTVSLVRNTYGTNPAQWPAVWNFGRVVRNAFAHGGRINIQNPAVPPVTWRSLTYAYSDNGREIVYQDMTNVELVILMDEMDQAV